MSCQQNFPLKYTNRHMLLCSMLAPHCITIDAEKACKGWGSTNGPRRLRKTGLDDRWSSAGASHHRGSIRAQIRLNLPASWGWYAPAFRPAFYSNPVWGRVWIHARVFILSKTLNHSTTKGEIKGLKTLLRCFFLTGDNVKQHLKKMKQIWHFYHSELLGST